MTNIALKWPPGSSPRDHVPFTHRSAFAYLHPRRSTHGLFSAE